MCFLEIAQVILAYTATGPEQLTLLPGQLIHVHMKRDSGWWEGELQVSYVYHILASFRSVHMVKVAASTSLIRVQFPQLKVVYRGRYKAFLHLRIVCCVWQAQYSVLFRITITVSIAV